MIRMIEKDLSEPYSVYTYRYFLMQWPFLCFMCYDGEKMVGCVISKMELHRGIQRGYIGMLAVDSAYRKRAIGSALVLKTVDAMKQRGVEEVMLETEVSNTAAIALYLRLGFLKDKRLLRYYMNGGDAFRLKVWLRGD